MYAYVSGYYGKNKFKFRCMVCGDTIVGDSRDLEEHVLSKHALVVPKHVMYDAVNIYVGLLLLYPNDYPRDGWYSLGRDWDLSLFVDENEFPCATLYPVIGGQTDTSRYYSLKDRLIYY